MPTYIDGLGNDVSAYVQSLEQKIAELNNEVLELKKPMQSPQVKPTSNKKGKQYG